MDFNKLSQQASSFMKNQNQGSNQDQSSSNTNTTQNTTQNPMQQTTDPSGQPSTMGNTTQNSGTAPQSGMAGTNTNAGANTGDMDYGDKGLAFLEQKTGHTMSREQNEKITDGARGAFEKFSGKKVDPKYSN